MRLHWSLEPFVLNQTLLKVAKISDVRTIVRAGPSAHGARRLRRHREMMLSMGVWAEGSEGSEGTMIVGTFFKAAS